jgi:hypothetical protein
VPLEPHPEEISDVNYDTDALNTLMKGYKEGRRGTRRTRTTPPIALAQPANKDEAKHQCRRVTYGTMKSGNRL